MIFEFVLESWHGLQIRASIRRFAGADLQSVPTFLAGADL